jgi:hypothetical protein
MPGFDCDEKIGPVLPTEPPNQGHGPYDPLAQCDAPNVLNAECDPGSSFQVLHRGDSDGIDIVAHCRKRGHDSLQYQDIAMIAYNRNNGAV